MIEQVVAAVTRALNLADAGNVDEAEQQIHDAWASLGLREADAMRLDDTTLRTMLGEKRELAVRLFNARSVVEDLRGNTHLATTFRTRARALL